MSRFLQNSKSLVGTLLLAGVFTTCVTAPVKAQSTYTGQLTGVVTDSSGGVVPGAKVSLVDEATNVGSMATTDNRGIYVFTGIRPATYSIRVEFANFGILERKGVVIAVTQQATIDFVLFPGSVSSSVTVTDQAPLLDTGDASLGTDVTTEYVRDIPLINRSMFGLVFLAGGVTETTGSGTTDNYPAGTNFVSNGQRNGTAEVRLDGALTSAPEQGEGGNTNVYYQPSVEIVQEFKVENNSFSAEYGNNGGTVVNLVLKQGGNEFHGSGWWFGQRSALDANDFFNNAQGIPKPDHLRDQYGFSLGGPIKKNKTFFFVDFEKLRDNIAVNISGTVPTAAERVGDFSSAPESIFNPFQCAPPTDPTSSAACTRPQFDYNGTPNVIDPNFINPIGKAILNLYPQPNVNLNDPSGLNNFRTSTVSATSGYQYDVKIDHNFNDKMRFAGRFSNLHQTVSTPFIVGDGTDANGNTINDGLAGSTDVYNIGLEYNWSLTPTTLWTSRFAVDRVISPGRSVMPTLQSVGLPSILQQANNLDRMPTIQTDTSGTDNELSLFNQCCTDTGFAHSLYSYSSAVSFVRGRHTIKAGFEQRQFLNNFFQPNYPTGYFYFPQTVTASTPTYSNTDQGNSFADILLGYGDSSSFINIQPSVADKSWETAFFVQDDLKITPKLTLNLGLRYEWSTPYTERYNHLQYSNFTGNTGVSLHLLPGQAPTELLGTTEFPGDPSYGRHLPVDRRNWAPRIGFAYSIDPKTVVRGGAGIYYGLNPATNYQYTGTAYSSTANIFFTQDNFQTQYATLANPFPTGLPVPQGKQYGPNPVWGYQNLNNLGTEDARNANIYQWNLGIQRLLPKDITIGIDYSASRSNHLPWGGDNVTTTRNRNFLPSSVRAQYVAQAASCVPTNTQSCPTATDLLIQLVDNPFLPFFQQIPGQPAPIYNQPSSLYNTAQIPLVNLLRPYPQFPGSFQGMPNLGANAFYNSVQVRFQKRASKYFSFEGNYTFSKATDDSSAGFNAFVGQLNAGNVQQLDQLKLEHGISGNDAPHRLVLAAIINLPVGRGLWLGSGMNPILNGIIGNWTVSAFITEQSGQPLAFSTAEGANGLFIDGNQRPNILCNQLMSDVSYHQAAANGLNGTGNPSVFNASCFGYPGDEVPGNAPRYISTVRGDGIHNTDFSVSKEFMIHEKMKLQIRGEFFNFTNTVRFAFPNTSVDSSSFGTVTSSANTPRHIQFGLRFEF